MKYNIKKLSIAAAATIVLGSTTLTTVADASTVNDGTEQATNITSVDDLKKLSDKTFLKILSCAC